MQGRVPYVVRDADLKPVSPNRDRDHRRIHPSLRSELNVEGSEVFASDRVHGFPFVGRVRLSHVVIERGRINHCQADGSHDGKTLQERRHGCPEWNDHKALREDKLKPIPRERREKRAPDEP